MRRASVSHKVSDFPNIDSALFKVPTAADFSKIGTSMHPPWFLMLHGALRNRSYSRLLTMEAACMLEAMGSQLPNDVMPYQSQTLIRCHQARLVGVIPIRSTPRINMCHQVKYPMALHYSLPS